MLAGLDKEGIDRELEETGEMAARADMSLTSPFSPKGPTDGLGTPNSKTPVCKQ
jgi:hypothetical protein